MLIKHVVIRMTNSFAAKRKQVFLDHLKTIVRLSIIARKIDI